MPKRRKLLENVLKMNVLLANFPPNVKNDNKPNEQKAHDQNCSGTKLQTSAVTSVILENGRVIVRVLGRLAASGVCCVGWHVVLYLFYITAC